jgi:CubicO group peptidase (beta-lactamase class C family)
VIRDEAFTSVTLTRRQLLRGLGPLCAAVSLRGNPVAQTPESTVTSMSAVPDLKPTALQVGAILGRHLASGYMTGAVAMIGQGDHAEVIEIGQRSQEHPGNVRRDSIFRIASMTKPITAAAAMVLLERQVLHLSDPVSRWLPELAHRRVLKRLDGPLDDTVPEQRPITVEDLLTLRCGWGILMAPPGSYPIQRRIDELGLLGFGPPDPSNQLHPDVWLKRLGTLPLMVQPGAEWLYNTGAYILGVLLARVTGRSLPELLQLLILEPLGMKDTGFFVPDSARDRLVSAYRLETGRTTLYDASTASAWSAPPAFPDGGAGLVSTVDDYFAFARMLLSGGLTGRRRLLSEASVALMTADHLSDYQREQGGPILGLGRGWGFGLGVIHGANDMRLPQGSFGWNGGLGTSWQSDPHARVTALLLTQTMFTSPAAPTVHQEFQRAVFAPTVT